MVRRKKLNRSLPAALLLYQLPVLISLLFVTGCSESNSPSSSIIRFALASGVTSLDPRFATDATSERVNRLLYTSLVKLDKDMLPMADMATWHQLSDKHYQFRLLPDRRSYINGHLPSAADVAATYRFVLDPKNLSPHRQAISMVDAVEVVDPVTVDFKLTHADPLFPAYLALAILPAGLISTDHDFNQQPVGSGPFRVLQRNTDQDLLLERRDDGQQIRLLQVKDPTVRVLKLINREVDLIQNDISPEMMAYLSGRAELNHLYHAGSNFTYLGMNLADPALSRSCVRKAIAHAIDRAAIVSHVFAGRARTAESILPPSHWAGHADLSAYSHDPELARQQLAECGYSASHRLQLNYKTSSDPFRIKLATIIQQQLQAVGIDVMVKSYDWGTFFGDIKSGNFQLYSLSWVGIRTPDIFSYAFHSASLPPAGANRGRYVSSSLDGLLDEVNAETTLDGQQRVYRLVQEVIHGDLPYVPLWYEDQNAFLDNRLVGYVLSADGNYDALNHVRYR